MNLVPTELNNIKHRRGVVSSFRIVTKPDSDGSQFFIVLSPQPGMDGKYSAFGSITEGIETVEKISMMPANDKGFAEKPVRIVSVRIEKRKPAPFLDARPNELHRTVTMKTTLGTIKIRMEPDWAVNHVRNFLMLTATGWYNGTEFHRIAKGFVVQGGIGETRSTGPEHPADRWVHNLMAEFSGVKHMRGSVSMARTSDPNSASTSFFLVLAPSSSLDGQYSIFGHVVSGMEVLDAFEKEKVSGERPKRRLEIIEATVDPD
jgi:cyclophilin family peptidyl-prolyl cis-trans isomerase